MCEKENSLGEESYVPREQKKEGVETGSYKDRFPGDSFFNNGDS